MKFYRFAVMVIQNITSIPFRIVFSVFARFSVTGVSKLSKLDTSKGVIFVSNHNSQTDSILVPSALPLFSKLFPVHFVSVASKYYRHHNIGRFFYGGWIFAMLGAVIAEKGTGDYGKALFRHDALLRNGGSILIYPEGRVMHEDAQAAHGGTTYLARKTGAIIVPVALTGEARLTLWDLFTFKRHIKVAFGDPIDPEALFSDIVETPQEMYREAAARVMSTVYALRATISSTN